MRQKSVSESKKLSGKNCSDFARLFGKDLIFIKFLHLFYCFIRDIQIKR